MGRGVGDVPPESGWGNFDPAQCFGDAFCLQYGRAIVDNAVFLFRNMKYIGVDLPAVGTGDDTPEWLALGISTVPPSTTDPQFACGQSRFGGQALVCWVCQDLPTLIYKQGGFDLEARLKGYPSIKDSFNSAALARNNIPSAIVLRDIQRDIKTGNISASTPYRIGEMVFLSAYSSDFINVNQNTDNLPYHVLLVIQGGTSLGQVLLAQVSYSAAGFFTSTEGVKGRFEVITLSNLLYRLAAENTSTLTDSQLNQIAADHIVRGIVR